jgi:hypothetical protein
MPEVVTQQQAKTRGRSRFFTGLPCKNGHVAERYTNARTCVECAHTRGERPSRKKPVRTTPEAEAAPPEDDRKPTWRDPGQRIPQSRIDACIDRIYGDAPRLGALTLSDAA